MAAGRGHTRALQPLPGLQELLQQCLRQGNALAGGFTPPAATEPQLSRGPGSPHCRMSAQAASPRARGTCHQVLAVATTIAKGMLQRATQA